jgi:hypothetical protein
VNVEGDASVVRGDDALKQSLWQDELERWFEHGPGSFQEIAYVSPTNTPSRGTAIITITDWGGLARASVERNLIGPATPMQIIYAASVGLRPPTPKNPINPGISIQSKDSLVVSLDAFLVLRYQ